ncbi:MAG: 6-bladed beta-propeller [Nitrospirae bacterium]|nr:MAG: 6-bladed beta-propeller [Nitrospirota bacterium]
MSRERSIGNSRKSGFLLALAASLLLSYACMSAPEHTPQPDIFWPKPPDEPRIKWVRGLRSELEIKEASTQEKILDAFLGEQRRGFALMKPYGVFSSNGTIYVAEMLGGVVAVFDTKTKNFHFIGSDKGPGKLVRPMGIAADNENRVYVTDSGQNRVVVFEKSGKYLFSFGTAKQFSKPSGIAVNDQEGKVYISDQKNHKIYAFSKKGDFLFEIGKEGEKDGEFNAPTHICVDNKNKLYVTDSLNFRVQIFDSNGKFISKFGQIGDGLGMFARPRGVAVDSEGNIYVVDAAFANVQIFDQKGNILMFFGGSGWEPGKFLFPAGISIDEEDKIYVSDEFNKRVSIFQYMGEKYKRSTQGRPNPQ